MSVGVFFSCVMNSAHSLAFCLFVFFVSINHISALKQYLIFQIYEQLLCVFQLLTKIIISNDLLLAKSRYFFILLRNSDELMTLILHVILLYTIMYKYRELAMIIIVFLQNNLEKLKNLCIFAIRFERTGFSGCGAVG